MDERVAALVRQFDLERLEINLFRGASRDIGSPQVYGGQVLGQALRAAYATVDAPREAHSLHAYFLQRGDPNAPIVYEVERSRDGHSFSSRRVAAIQQGRQIFHMACSFQLPQGGVEHQQAMPPAAAPEKSPPSELNEGLEVSAKMREFLERHNAFDCRIVEQRADDCNQDGARRELWLRVGGRLPDDDALHRCLLAYASDFHLLHTAMLPHRDQFVVGHNFIASIDHAMWFHRPVRVDEWFLTVTDSPSAGGSRGFARGTIFSHDGRLVASTAQEGLMRVGDPPRT